MSNRRIIQMNSVAKEVFMNFCHFKQLSEELSISDGSNHNKEVEREKTENQLNLCLRRLEWSLNDLFECIQVLHNIKVKDEEHQQMEAHYLMAKQVIDYLNNCSIDCFESNLDMSSKSTKQTFNDIFNENLKQIENNWNSLQTFI